MDATTLDPMRVNISRQAHSAENGVRGIEEVIHYEVMRIGNTEASLPHNSELGVIDDTGNCSLNQVELQYRRVFKTNSIVQ